MVGGGSWGIMTTTLGISGLGTMASASFSGAPAAAGFSGGSLVGALAFSFGLVAGSGLASAGAASTSVSSGASGLNHILFSGIARGSSAFAIFGRLMGGKEKRET